MILPLLLLFLPQAQSTAPVEAVVTTDAGEFRIVFAPEKAPRHVEQFIRLAKQGFYDGGAFHRAVAYGIVQGGDPLLKDPATPRNLWGSGGLNLLSGEYSDLKHDRGTVSTISIPGKPESDGAQFFICLGPQTALDGKYSAFGRVTEGLDVVEKISQSPLDENGLLKEPVRIRKVALVAPRLDPYATATTDDLRKTVILKTTVGQLKLMMDPEWAPEHVRNFLRLVATGWYNGTAFHRVSKDFVVQGGMANSREGGKGHYADRWVHPLKGEFRPEVKHTRGIVSMARTDDPNSAMTSFFLMLGPAPHLDGQYTAFAHIVEGLATLAAFEKEEVDGETPKRRLEIIEAVIE